MFGCKPHLPIDLIFWTNIANLKGNHITYIENLKKRMAWAYQTANDVIKKEQERNKWCYDCRVWCTKLMIGHKVLLWCIAYKGRHKIQNCWEDTIYEPVDQPFKNMPVFKIKPWGSDDRVKIVHRKLLLPLLSDPLDLAGEPNNSRSLANLKETMNTQVAFVVSAIACHVHNLGTYEVVWVTNLIQKGLKFVTILRNTEVPWVHP